MQITSGTYIIVYQKIDNYEENQINLLENNQNNRNNLILENMRNNKQAIFDSNLQSDIKDSYNKTTEKQKNNRKDKISKMRNT